MVSQEPFLRGIRMPASIWGVYSFEDEGVTIKILEYFESTSNRLIQEKRKENIYYLLSIYENILKNSLFIKYADKNIGAQGENPLLTLILAYYVGLIEKLANSKENDWIWESIKSISNVSNTILMNTDNYFVQSQINQTISKISLACFNEKQETFLKEILNIYFNQIKIAWDKYEHNRVFWKDLFKEFKKSILMLSISSNLNLSTSELFMGFHQWQGLVANHIFGLTDNKKKKEYIDKFILLTEKWSDFLLDFARDMGLENKSTGLPIIQSIDNNLRIIYVIRNNFNDIDLKNLYRTQLSTLSWYFEKTDKVDSNFLFNMEEVLQIILREIRDNLDENIFDVDHSIDLYIRLVQQHFEKVSVGYGYNHPRVIEKLIYVGLLLHKHRQTKKVNNIIKLIDELNKKYLELNKEYFELKNKNKNLMGPDEFQLCFEIHNLENDLFSYNSSVMMDIKSIIKKEITRKDWDSFISKISYCKGISYKTVSRF